ncbi:methylenetetrahydrofolate--tRNA-(uracil-5-)-methyltransferase [Desulfitispora alkaliphila]|uniref:methylenetetrahydrofolate--tRNA-(uracil(54)- C(5))-methyltransferase (FADH(2)-oxidizing) TrmFO n=1 Tax=Desulfitispora alkaliphila TaxID=622674 RepID=UPI003D1C905F
MKNKVTVIGAGLAGSEAAWQLANRGVHVDLYEMRPNKQTPAHKTGYFAELVCSNSLRAANIENAVGLLKEELRRFDSIIIKCADEHQVPAGGALAVDRNEFAKAITEAIEGHENINIIREEVSSLEFEHPVIVATGPLTSESMSQSIAKLTGENYLYFYDAAAPIVTKESINMDVAYYASRYDKGEPAYINCPLSETDYKDFYSALITGEQFETKEFEKQVFFEGCMPIEEMAWRGEETLKFGPMKPVGLKDPRTGEIPHAVVQLRQENKEGTLYNMVGFQTKLKWPEQKRVFSMIPGLENAEFVRMGVIHRNTFLNAPELLTNSMRLKKSEQIFFAGQITGVEGYVESTASGLVAAINSYLKLLGKEEVEFPKETAIGALGNYLVSSKAKKFQPMNINYGLFPPLGKKIKDKKEKNRRISERALGNLSIFQNNLTIR